jgi:hypothetical protein
MYLFKNSRMFAPYCCLKPIQYLNHQTESFKKIKNSNLRFFLGTFKWQVLPAVIELKALLKIYGGILDKQ